MARISNTMAEGLQTMLGSIATMKALPDADLQFLIELETGILKKLREPVDNMAGQLQSVGQNGPPPGGMPGGPPPGGMPPGMPMPPMGAPGGAPTGMPMGAGAPNPDELQRLIGGNAGG